MRNIFKLLLFSIIVCVSPPLLAQTIVDYGLDPQKAISQYQCETWQKDRGLPQNSVFSITQSSDGYLWLATYEGLARFDGLTFDNFNTSNVSDLESNAILDIYEDRKGKLWIATNGGGLSYYHQGKFKTYSTESGLASNVVNVISEDQKGQLWVGTRKGLCRLEGEKFKVYNSRESFSSRDITALLAAKNGNLWVGTSRGLSIYRDGQFEDFRNKILFIDKNISSLSEDARGNIWIGTHQGLVRWNPNKQNYQTYRIQDGLSDDYITDLYQDHLGTLWIATQSGGLNRLVDAEQMKLKPRFEYFTVNEGLSANSVTSIYEDQEGSLWIGLNRGGLNRLRDGKFTNYTSTEGLSDNVTNCLYEDREGGIWIGTVSGGISYLKDGKMRVISNENLKGSYIRSITQDQKGYIWVASYGNGVSVMQKDSTWVNYDIEDGLAGNICRSIYAARDGSIWIGTKTGLSHYKDGKFQNYYRHLGLSDNSITSITEDRQGNIWIGTDGAGVNCLRKDGNIIIYRMRQGLANDFVFSIYEDAQGVIWIGTKSGLSRLEDGEIRNFFSKDGLPSDAIHSILEDSNNRLWISCNQGVFYLDKYQIESFIKGKRKTLNAPLFQEEDGMKSSDCAVLTQPAALRDRNGFLWYPTTEGVCNINPNNIRLNRRLPQVVIKRLVVDNQVIDIYSKAINLKAGAAKIEIDFAALSFLAPESVQYEYKLEGDRFSEDWQQVGNKRDAYYTNLPPGNYTFRVRASNNDGIWNEKGISLKFYLEPFFYQRTIFYVLMALLLISGAFGVYYWRLRGLERSKRLLEQQVQARTTEVRQQYEEITRQTEELETINKIVQIVNQEVKLEKVLHALLEQALSLFEDSQQGIFISKRQNHEYLEVVANIGYEKLSTVRLSESTVKAYCQNGLLIEENLYRLEPKHSGKALIPDYHPYFSLALQIKVEQELIGLMLLDRNQDPSEESIEISDEELSRLKRFKEHAVSAFYKAQLLDEIEHKSQQLEQSFRKISDSIRYARRIQSAILGDKEDILRFFSDGFVLYEPRDIVSGDFYWATESVPDPVFGLQDTEEGRISVFKGFGEMKYVLAAVDCTGHGVPGAFMTVVGHDLLTSIVIEEKVAKPHLILDRLDQQVRTYLKQEEGSQSRDGMDIGLVVIDDINEVVEFSGAKNPIYHFRNGELNLIKGSKYPIGGAQIKNKRFDLHSIPYQPGDVFYLCSDGFQDQFGGDRDRKYGVKRFRELLQEIHQQPMKAQEQRLRAEFEQWKGEKRQTDDVLVIGFKF